MATVYVEVVDTYSRTVWDPATVAYSVGDRVSYDDGTDEIYVCIVGHTSAASPTPDNDSTNWVLAGSEEYPFQVKNVANNIGSLGAAGGEFNLDKNAGVRTTGNFCLDAAGDAGTIIMGDGTYDIPVINNQHALDVRNVNLTAKNHLQARLTTSYVWGVGATPTSTSTLTGLRIGTSQSAGAILGSITAQVKFRSCIIEDSTPFANASGNAFYTFTTGAILDLQDCEIKILHAGCAAMQNNTPAGSKIINCTFLTQNGAMSTTFWGGTNGAAIFRDLIYYVISSTLAGSWQIGGSGVWTNITWFVAANPGGSVDITLRGGGGGNPPTVNGQYVDPGFVNAATGDTRLRPNSPCIGGGKAELVGVYYLQPGNTFNGDGSRVEPATGDGDPGPFNSFTAVKDAAIANDIVYGSTIVIVDGTYAFPSEFKKVSPTHAGGGTVTYEGFAYQAQSDGNVVFDNSMALGAAEGFGFVDGGIQRDTSFTGVVFKNIDGTQRSYGTFLMAGGDRTSTVIFTSCKFLNIIVGDAYGFISKPRIGAYDDGPDVHLSGCEVYWAADSASYSSVIGYYSVGHYDGWKLEDCTFYNGGVHLTTFAGKNASNANGWYGAMTVIQGSTYGLMTIKNCIFSANQNPGGSAANDSNRMSWYGLVAARIPTIDSCAFYNIQNLPAIVPDANNLKGVDPLFIAPDSHEFHLRPTSPMIGGLSSDRPGIWVSNTPGSGGTGTEDDPFYFGDLAAAQTAAGSYGTIIFKDGTYLASTFSLTDFAFNTPGGTLVNYEAETSGGVTFLGAQIFFGSDGATWNTLATTQSLIYKGINFQGTDADDSIVMDQAQAQTLQAHTFDSCTFTATAILEEIGTNSCPKVIFFGCLFSTGGHVATFEQRNGNTVDNHCTLKNCTIQNYGAPSPLSGQVFVRIHTLYIENCIVIDFTDAVGSLHSQTINYTVAGQNTFIHSDGTKIPQVGGDIRNLGVLPSFIDPANKNFSLRPTSPLIGQGT